MFKFTTASLVALAATAASVHAQEIPAGPANASAIALVEAQYNASGFDVALPNSQSFNIPLNATALLTVVYDGNLTVENGSPYTAAQVATKPTIYVTPESEMGFNETDMFTLMLADASAVGQADPEGDYRHYLSNSISGGATMDNLTFALGNGTVITSYAGPGPLANSGVHRYAWLLFSQPADFAAPANLSTSTGPSHWSVESYVTDSKLGSLVAASFFTVVHEGDSTASAVPTSSVDPATLSVASTTALASGASSGAAAATSGIGGAAAGSNTGAAASSFVVAKTLALVAAAAGAFVVLA